MKNIKREMVGTGGDHIVRRNTTRFLIGSFVLIFAVCIGILVTFSRLTDNKSEETINEISSLYMTGMNERIAMHFEATIEARMSRVEYLVSSVSPDESPDYETMKAELTYGARISNLSILGLYAGDGAFEPIYGEAVTLADSEPFLESLKNGEEKIAAGVTSQGEQVILFGVPASYVMRDGKKSIALAAAVPVDYIKQFLALDNDYSLVYSHIIRRDGSLVIQSRPTETDNYFDQIRLYFEEGNQDGEECVRELKQSMEEKEDFSALFYSGNDRRHFYCTPLSYSEWYLITIMPYGSFDTTVEELTSQRFVLLLASIGIILVVLLVIFFMYYRRTQKQLQAVEDARLAAEQASRAKSEFLSNMSHDIRTPMNAILGMTAIATSHIDNTPQVQDCLKKISLSGRHLLGLINDVLDMSKIESGKMTLSAEQVSLPELLNGIVSIVQPQVREKQQRFDIFIHDISTEQVYCDSVRLNQVLLNLLSNAIKFTPRGGSVGVSLYEDSSPRGEGYVRVHLKVKDNGIGMSPKFREKIFESFTREDNRRVNRIEGTGLGMAITKYIIDAMEGSIEVESELGKGTQFHVVLDLEKLPDETEDMLLPPWKMLLVDDDEELRRSALASLKSIGIWPDCARDGQTAVAMVEERHKKRDDYQIILLDWQLPDMDGVETARQIRRKMGEEIPILLISAYDWSDIEQEAKEAGVTGFIAKPLFKSTLFYGIKRYTEDAGLPADQSLNYPTDFQGARLLVAEDNELNWEIACELLSQLGLELDWAENGQACVEKFGQSQAGYYAAILMDIRMPVMTGFEATQAIRSMERQDAGIPIIAMTADAFFEDIQKCLDCGMNAHIPKPIDVREVARLLERYIR